MFHSEQFCRPKSDTHNSSLTNGKINQSSDGSFAFKLAAVGQEVTVQTK